MSSGGWRHSPYSIVVKSLVVAALFILAKWAVHQYGWERIVTIQVTTSLLGGVIFTLAIILSGVVSDFKESERMVSELSSLFRRLPADLALVATGERLAAMRKEISAMCSRITADLREGEGVRTSKILPHVDKLDALLLEAARSGAPSSQIRTIQVNLTSFARVMDRLETIIETTFLRAAYIFAWVCVAGLLVVLTIASLEPFVYGLALVGFAAFLLSGLCFLVYDLDNPFSGAVHTSTEQLEKVNEWLRKAS